MWAVFDIATSIGAAIMVVWNVMLMILKATLLAGLVLMVTAPDSFLDNFFLGIIAVVTKIACEFIANIQAEVLERILDAIVSAIKLFPEIVVSDTVEQISGAFSTLALSLITAFFVYQSVKNVFSFMGFDGEPALNTLIVYIITTMLLISLNWIISVLLQMIYDLSDIFIEPLTGLGEKIAGNFKGLTTVGGNDSLVAIGTNVLVVIMLGKIITSSIDMAMTIIQKMVIISVMIMIGPIMVSFAVLKSMRSVMVTWFKSLFIANFVYLMYAIMLFLIYNNASTVISAIANSNVGAFENVIELLVLAAMLTSVPLVEGVVTSMFTGMASGGGSSGGLGISLPGASTVNHVQNALMAGRYAKESRQAYNSAIGSNKDGLK